MDGFDEAVSKHHDAVTKQLETVEAENARLRAREKEWQAAAGGLEEPGMLALAVNHQTAMLEQSQDRERTALRERDAIRDAWRVAEDALRVDLNVALRERDENRDAYNRKADELQDALSERDELRTIAADRGTEALEAIAACDAEKKAREAAEADCAAMWEVLRRFERVRLMGSSVAVCLECMRDEGHDESCFWGWALHGAAPVGAALLERLRAAEDVIARCQKELRARDMEAEDLPHAVLAIIEAHGRLLVVELEERARVVAAEKAAEDIDEERAQEISGLKRDVESMRDQRDAAVAVVEAARKLCLTDEVTVYALSGAITAYDALGAEGEAVEP